AGNSSVANRGQVYGMTGAEIDGNDVEAIYRLAGDAIERARAGGGPTLLECKTYRTRPHAEGMGDFGYRTREQVEEWKTRCPIKRLRERIDDKEALAKIEAEVAGRVAEALKFAESSPWPEPASATEHVYAACGFALTSSTERKKHTVS